MGINTKR